MIAGADGRARGGETSQGTGLYLTEDKWKTTEPAEHRERWQAWRRNFDGVNLFLTLLNAFALFWCSAKFSLIFGCS
jgi:hypothetical protein